MRGRKRSFRGPLGLPIEVSTARAMSNAIINYLVVADATALALLCLSLPSSYPCQLSPPLGSFLYLPVRGSPSFPFLSVVHLSFVVFRSISLNARVEEREGSFRHWTCSCWFPAVYFYTRHSDYLAIVDMTLRVPRVLAIVRCWMSCLKNQRVTILISSGDPEKKIIRDVCVILVL